MRRRDASVRREESERETRLDVRRWRRASVLVRVKLFSLVFVRTHRLVSQEERGRERDEEKTKRDEGEGERPRMEERREPEERRGRGAKGEKDRA